MSAIAIFTCRQNSHPFQERHVSIEEPVKIGRSVARSRPVPNNAIFDCKVLSRNHALMWYENGVFYLQDTKSSNGTFINNQRLSKGSEESAPHELYSNDIVQFGVDVMENSRRVTHSCIIAQVQLFHPDGREATNEHSSSFLANGGGGLGSQSQELYQISQYLQEALHREQMLENKLATLQRLVQQTQEASDSGWQALIDEDRLLSRLEVLENQLAAYSKNQTEDTIRQELTNLQEDKYNYETRAKESLHKILLEKFDAARNVSDLERSLSNTEDECGHLRDMCETSQKELQSLAEKHAEKIEEFSALQEQLQNAEKIHNDAVELSEQDKAELQRQLDDLGEEEQRLQAKVEELQASNDFTKEQLTNMKAKMEALRENNGDTPRISEQENRGIQVDMVNLLDLQLLHSKDSDDDDDDSSSDDDDDDLKVKDILDCLDQSIEGKLNKDLFNDSDNSKENDSMGPEELKDTVCETTSSSPNQEKLKQAQSKMESCKSHLEQSSLKIKESHNKVEKLQGELEQARCDISSKASKIASLEMELKMSDDHRNNMVENAVTDIRSQLIEAEEETKASSALTQQLKDQVSSLEMELEKFHVSAISNVVPLTTAVPTHASNNHVDPSASVVPLQEIATLTGLLDEAKKAQSEKDDEISRYKSDLESSRDKLSEVTTEITSLRNQLEEVKKTATDKLDQNTKLRDRLCELELSSKDVRQQMISLKGVSSPEYRHTDHAAVHNTTTTGELSEAQLNTELAQSEADKLKLQVRSIQEELDFEQSIKSADDTSKELPANASQAKWEFISLKKERDSLRTSIHDLENEMGISSREKHKLQTDYSKLQESYHELQTNCGTLQESYLELEQLKDKLEDRELAWQLNMTDSQKQSDQSKAIGYVDSSQQAIQPRDVDSSQQAIQPRDVDSSQQAIQPQDGDSVYFRGEISRLEESLHEMEEEYDFLAYKSRTMSACSIIPLIVLCFAIVMAFYPILSMITGTATPNDS